MNEELKEIILDFQDLSLIDDIYQGLNDDTYQEAYENVKEKRVNKVKTTLTKLRYIKNRTGVFVFMILQFINNLCIRFLGFLTISAISSPFHAMIHEKSFELMSQYGMKIYDALFAGMFHMNAQTIFESSYNELHLTNSLISINSSYMLFYAVFLTIVMFCIWSIVFIVKMVKKDKVNQKVVSKEYTIQSCLLFLKCDEYSGLEYIKKQLKKYYMKNQLNRNIQLKYIQAYTYLMSHNSFLEQIELSEDEKRKFYFYITRRMFLHILNWICNGLLISGFVMLIYYRFVDMFIVRGYLKELWIFMESVHHEVDGSILNFIPLYQEASLSIQIVLSNAFLIFLFALCIRFYGLIVNPFISLKIRYRDYLIAKRGNIQINKFNDKYGIHWLILTIIIGIVIGSAIYLDAKQTPY